MDYRDYEEAFPVKGTWKVYGFYVSIAERKAFKKVINRKKDQRGCSRKQQRTISRH